MKTPISLDSVAVPEETFPDLARSHWIWGGGGDLVLKTTKTGKKLHTNYLFVDTIYHRLFFFPSFCWELFCSK